MTADQIAADYRVLMNRVARHLVVNHLRQDLQGVDWQPVLGQESDLPDLRRTIAVVGAGASKAAGLPLAREAIDRLRRELDVSEVDHAREAERLELIHGFGRDQLETALLAFSYIVYPPSKVRDHVHELYRLRYHPLLTYEILAHMLKHRFLDAIINFNFDELLDQAITDELSAHDYHYIVHDGDCPDAARDPERPFGLPVYLKPHGTASHRSSLRFTREAYYGIPGEVRRVLQNLFSGMPITLLVIGFSMQSPEFNRLLEQSDVPLEIFYLNINRPQPQLEPSRFKDRFIPVDQDTQTGLDDTMRELWRAVEETFRTPYYAPRGVERHELVSRIFANPGIPIEEQLFNDANLEKYLYDRAIVELAMSIAKAKGLVNMGVISEDRCGKYYDLYCKEAALSDHTLLYEMCRSLGLKEIGYAREAFRLGSEEIATRFWIVSESAFREHLNQLYEKVLRQLSAQNQREMRACRDLFEATLLYLYQSEEIELGGYADPLYNKIFRNSRPIRTLSGLSYETERVLQEPEWNKLLIVAETGEWLLAPRIVDLLSNRDVEIYMVVADKSFEAELETAYGTNLIELRQLPWWDHNRHLTLLLDDRIPYAAIYFTRRLRSPNIAPVILTAEDARVVLDAFIAYWLKADLDRPWIGIEEIDKGSFFDNL